MNYGVFHKLINSLSDFNKGEKRAILVFLLVMVSLTIYLFSKNLSEATPLSDVEITKVDSLIALMDTTSRYPKQDYKKNQKKYTKSFKPKKKITLSPTFFNPNKASKEELLALGLPSKVVSTIVNFRNKNGKFYKVDDLKKIYGMKDHYFDQLKDYVVLEKPKAKKPTKISSSKKDSIKRAKPNKSYQKDPKKEKTIRLVDINSADSISLKEIRGIGPYLAYAIVAQRERLGGYYDISQLREIRGLREETFNMIENQLIVKGDITKIDINIANEKQLARHPYISWSQAKLILKYREQHGPYRSIEDLKKIKAFKISFFNKIAPYIEV